MQVKLFPMSRFDSCMIVLLAFVWFESAFKSLNPGNPSLVCYHRMSYAFKIDT